MANSETRNSGYEAHPLFPIYERHRYTVDRCDECGSEDLYSTAEGPDSRLMCNDCERETVEDYCSFVEWCEGVGFNPNRLDAVEILSGATIDYLVELVRQMDDKSKEIRIVGEYGDEDI